MAKRKHSVYFDYEKGEFVGLTDEIMQKLAKEFPAMDISKEILKMSLWLKEHKSRCLVGTVTFILNWLGNNSYKLHHIENKPIQKEKPIKTDPLISAYLEELWKNSASLLSFNTLTV